jgi:hypothetical protein
LNTTTTRKTWRRYYEVVDDTWATSMDPPIISAVTAVLDIVHGQLVYPVWEIQISPTVAELVVAVYYGGLHAVVLLFGLATIVLSVAMKRGGYGNGIAYLGIATGLGDFVGSYPWAIGPIALLVSGAVRSLLAVGAKLARAH